MMPICGERCRWCGRWIWPWQGIMVRTMVDGSAGAMHWACGRDYLKSGQEQVW